MVWWTLALAAAQGLSQAQGQKANADAINRAQRQFEKLNAKLANKAYAQDLVAISAGRLQQRDQLVRSLEEVTLDATRRIGSVSVSAGESGLIGNTQAALVRDFKVAQLKAQTVIMDTEKYMQEQYGRDVDAARANRDSRILTAKQQRVPGPNYMQIAIDAATSYIQMQQTYDAANKYNGQPVTNQSVPQHGPGGYGQPFQPAPPSYPGQGGLELPSS